MVSDSLFSTDSGNELIEGAFVLMESDKGWTGLALIELAIEGAFVLMESGKGWIELTIEGAMAKLVRLSDGAEETMLASSLLFCSTMRDLLLLHLLLLPMSPLLVDVLLVLVL